MPKLFRKVTYIVFGFIVLLAVAQKILESKQSVGLPVLGNLPEFNFTNSRGEFITLADFKGKVWAADFIFTTCAGPCPIMTGQMNTVHKEFLNNDKVRQVSISVNPDYDTPEVLSEYAARYNADTKKWQFLTGDYEDIQNLILNGFKMGDPDEIIFHSTKFALVDRQGQIRGYYSGTEPKEITKLKEDIRKLLKES